MMGTVEFDLTNAEFSGQFLQFAILIFGTGQAGLRVIAEHQLQHCPAGMSARWELV